MASDMRQQSSNRGRPSISPNGPYPKVLHGRTYLLDIENKQSLSKVAEAIQNYGGSILVSYDDRDPHCLVSDHSTILTAESKGAAYLKNERVVKTLPALLRKAQSKGIKIRSPALFLKQLKNHLESRKKTTSATTSHSTMRARQELKPIREKTPIRESLTAPRTSRTSSAPSTSTPKEDQAFLRIDVPTRRPDIRLVPRSSFQMLYAGTDAGHSIFKPAEAPLKERRQREYAQFREGRYAPTKKPFKLDDKDTFCQFCQKQYTGERKDHEKTDEHRNKARVQGFTPALERAVLTAKLNLKRQEDGEMKTRKRLREKEAFAEESKRARVAYEYGENETFPNWESLKSHPTVIKTERAVKRMTEKANAISPRRRQQRIQPRTSQGDLI